MFVENGEKITVRTFQVCRADGTEFWQGRLMLELSEGARWHRATTMPHASREEAEREALALARSKQRAPSVSALLAARHGGQCI